MLKQIINNDDDDAGGGGGDGDGDPRVCLAKLVIGHFGSFSFILFFDHPPSAMVIIVN